MTRCAYRSRAAEDHARARGLLDKLTSAVRLLEDLAEKERGNGRDMWLK